MTEMHMAGALSAALLQEMEADARVVVLGEDVGADGGVFRITDGLQKRFGPARVMDTPLAESGIAGASIGMAVAGLCPVAEIQFSGFSYPAFEQIISHAARIRNRTRGRFSCPLVIRMPCAGGVRALEHHQESTEALYAHIPGLKVVMPATPHDAKGLLAASIADPDPVIFFEPMILYRLIRQEVPEKRYTVPIGKSNVLREGSDVTVITYGSMVPQCLRAVEMLGEKTSVHLLDLRTLSPLDTDGIVAAAKRTGRVVVVHEAPRTLGVGAEITAILNEKALYHLEAPVERVTGFDTIPPLAKLDRYYLPNAVRILDAVQKVMGA